MEASPLGQPARPDWPLNSFLATCEPTVHPVAGASTACVLTSTGSSCLLARQYLTYCMCTNIFLPCSDQNPLTKFTSGPISNMPVPASSPSSFCWWKSRRDAIPPFPPTNRPSKTLCFLSAQPLDCGGYRIYHPLKQPRHCADPYEHRLQTSKLDPLCRGSPVKRD